MHDCAACTGWYPTGPEGYAFLIAMTVVWLTILYVVMATDWV